VPWAARIGSSRALCGLVLGRTLNPTFSLSLTNTPSGPAVGSRLAKKRESYSWITRIQVQLSGSGIFRDLNAAIVRMATLAPGGRISVDLVREEMGGIETPVGEWEVRGGERWNVSCFEHAFLIFSNR